VQSLPYICCHIRSEGTEFQNPCGKSCKKLRWGIRLERSVGHMIDVADKVMEKILLWSADENKTISENNKES
jgi:hypothetical protein